MNKPKLTIAAYLLLIFAAGAISGGSVAWHAAKSAKPAFPPQHRKPPTEQEFCDHLMKRFTEKLDLTEDQARQIRPLVLASMSEVRQLQEKSVREVKAVMLKTDERIAEFLTDDQKPKLLEMQKEREKWEKRRERRGPPPGPSNKEEK